MVGVYKITFPNGWLYIGSGIVENRWKSHKVGIRNGKHPHRWFNQYLAEGGSRNPDDYQWEILLELPDDTTRPQRESEEDRIAHEYIDRGYTVISGTKADLYIMCTLKPWNAGGHIPAEERFKISETMKKKRAENPELWQKQVEASKRKKSETHKNNIRKSQPKYCPIYQCDLDGNPIRRFESAMLVKKVLGFNQGMISYHVKDGKPYKGYLWLKVEDVQIERTPIRL